MVSDGAEVPRTGIAVNDFKLFRWGGVSLMDTRGDLGSTGSDTRGLGSSMIMASGGDSTALCTELGESICTPAKAYS